MLACTHRSIKTNNHTCDIRTSSLKMGSKPGPEGQTCPSAGPGPVYGEADSRKDPYWRLFGAVMFPEGRGQRTHVRRWSQKEKSPKFAAPPGPVNGTRRSVHPTLALPFSTTGLNTRGLDSSDPAFTFRLRNSSLRRSLRRRRAAGGSRLP